MAEVAIKIDNEGYLDNFYLSSNLIIFRLDKLFYFYSCYLMKIVLPAIIITLLLYYLYINFPGAINEFEKPQLVYSLLVLLILFSSFAVRKTSWKQNLRFAFYWLIIFLFIIIGYSYKAEMKNVYYRIVGNLLPSSGQIQKNGSVKFFKSANDHFFILANADNKLVKFMLDTGATITSLSKTDALRLGFDLEQLDFNIPVNTANGLNYVARGYIEELKIGSITIYNLECNIHKNGLDNSLLGMNFLNKLSSYHVTNNQLTLNH